MNQWAAAILDLGTERLILKIERDFATKYTTRRNYNKMENALKRKTFMKVIKKNFQ